ncbi:hypothetical protein L6452_08347 [Arctium lappa]|uniref:Uncharacterized protein n=1 Tax=Arctium lappa TaxID=4217 RepID=A0ACB9DHD3_ARCLA|nr:hypothetical protein L6452_08347 [Arctium lappa]
MRDDFSNYSWIELGLDNICGCSAGEANLCLYALIWYFDLQFWTESFVQWSPLGTYLATVHRQGAAVWGGASIFNRLMHYAYPQVKLIDFSPGEKYLVTYSSHEPSTPHDSHRVLLNIFDVRTGKVMRDFKRNADEFAFRGTGGFTGVSWPVFRNWSGPSVAAMCDASIYSRGWSGVVCVA